MWLSSSFRRFSVELLICALCTKSLKWETLKILKTLVHRAHINCLTEKHLKEELNHIRKTFNEIKNYLHWVVTQVFKEIKDMTHQERKSK